MEPGSEQALAAEPSGERDAHTQCVREGPTSRPDRRGETVTRTGLGERLWGTKIAGGPMERGPTEKTVWATPD